MFYMKMLFQYFYFKISRFTSSFKVQARSVRGPVVFVRLLGVQEMPDSLAVKKHTYPHAFAWKLFWIICFMYVYFIFKSTFAN